ncbi:MAG TPA: hypothetical protein VEX16_03790 [Methyloceanibacter sp.]|nr:hypothetical protein [Methyloceanibacter sp.]
MPAALVNERDILLVAAQAVDRFREENVKFAPLNSADQLLDSGPEAVCPGHAFVVVAGDDFPSFACRTIVKKPQLLLNAVLVLSLFV